MRCPLPRRHPQSRRLARAKLAVLRFGNATRVSGFLEAVQSIRFIRFIAIAVLGRATFRPERIGACFRPVSLSQERKPRFDARRFLGTR